MNKVCTNCGKEVDKNLKFCGSCGNALKNISNKDNRKSNKIVKIVLVSCILFVLGYFLFKTFEPSIIGNYYLHKYVKPDLEQQYSDTIDSINFINKQSCIESYNTCAGDDGSGRRKIKDCDIYIYNVNMKNNNIARAYVFSKNGVNTVYDEIVYGSLEAMINQYKQKLQFNKIEYSYSDYFEPDIYESFEETLSNKEINLNVNNRLSNVLNKEYLNNIIELNNMLNNYIRKENTLLKKVGIVFHFSDESVAVVKGSVVTGHGELYIQNKTTSKRYSINFTANDEEIKWCLDNSESSYVYRKLFEQESDE